MIAQTQVLPWDAHWLAVCPGCERDTLTQVGSALIVCLHCAWYQIRVPEVGDSIRLKHFPDHPIVKVLSRNKDGSPVVEFQGQRVTVLAWDYPHQETFYGEGI